MAGIIWGNKTTPCESPLSDVALSGGRHIRRQVSILEYLEETHPEPPLLPKEPSERAKVARHSATNHSVQALRHKPVRHSATNRPAMKQLRSPCRGRMLSIFVRALVDLRNGAKKLSSRGRFCRNLQSKCILNGLTSGTEFFTPSRGPNRL